MGPHTVSFGDLGSFGEVEVVVVGGVGVVGTEKNDRKRISTRPVVVVRA